ncbi:prephenate dehydrogenase [Bathymodiolus septemdierum thioautotrophic gill symbiont]|uniref:prephenate dehydrogenase n=1 Tax=endosymbiont of Bathymodiolus septemdierum str. Myojin knoll TaxID=1303921 RepID=A0A0P0URR6_9GAMM|nr:prephenate dehydrogenase/arogenate dehydrogenase family protein [Bathymodiolus septemdierum thioautotrophic gill symbiont]BAS67765.1 prephenate dehydrogenase [endosymbiont of Bathymodiolus septemdierum str. Myojin knoll]
MNKICIIGVGLIGGSFALGLKKAGKVHNIIGYSRSENNLKMAVELGVIDSYSTDIGQALSGVDMVLIATPVNSFQSVLEMIKPHIDENVIISDVGSTKGSVIAMAKAVFGIMPSRFIPAHPIAGKEKSGVEAADATLFKGKRVILTPTENTDTQALITVSDLWESIGARVEVLDDKIHDDLLAMTSHLPHMLAFSLMDYLINSDASALNYAAGGFKDFSRIASSDASMWRDICINNADEIVKHIEGFQRNLSQISDLIKGAQAQEIESLFVNAKTARDNWLNE